ncbi:MAG: hypothetical protein OXM02_04000 [Bacteroidota bacterium]|nr:hypothetical protein [Bacteroidota bacterium]
MAMLLSPASPESGEDDASIEVGLDFRSGSHARDISPSLRNALRSAVELLGNEYVLHAPEVDARALTVECIRYMYRLLFLLTVEARQQTEYLPMNAQLHREKLTELAQWPLGEDDAAEGISIHEALMLIFAQLNGGQDKAVRQPIIREGPNPFSLAPPRCDLFDPDTTPLLSSIKVRNATWRTIIRSLSPGHTDKGVGRDSFAQLSIDRLGEVFDALCGFTGFVACEDLYEVKPAKEPSNPLGPVYFVSQEVLEMLYQEDERVCDDEGKVVCHPKGRFIYRLTGRARDSSASLRASESPLRYVVGQTLNEVIEGKSADELLQITICDPAMGSAAGLNEAVSRLAEVYMNRATRELGELLSPEAYTRHAQRVKLYLADNNVYGVDVNPVAVELGGISLWLNTWVPGGFVPWFGTQFQCGNAFVGAWRRVYEPAALKQGKWWEAPPEEVAQARGAIYHFLVGDAGMVSYKGKVFTQLAKGRLRHITLWRKAFTAPLSGDDIKRLRLTSNRIDELWDIHIQDLKRLKDFTTDPFPFYPSELPAKRAIGSAADKDAKLNQILDPPGGLNASAYQRLKLVMDYWCALWFWPVQQAFLLPTRSEFISDIALILAGREEAGTADVFSMGSRDGRGHMDVNKLIARLPRLQVVRQLARKEQFHHWPLVYANQFADRGGFDMIIGNPPRLRKKFSERDVLGDIDPRFAVKKLTVSQRARMRTDWIKDEDNAQQYMRHCESALGRINFQNAVQNFPALKGAYTDNGEFPQMQSAKSRARTVVQGSGTSE